MEASHKTHRPHIKVGKDEEEEEEEVNNNFVIIIDCHCSIEPELLCYMCEY